MVPTALIHCPFQILLCDALPAEAEWPTQYLTANPAESSNTLPVRQDSGTDPGEPGELEKCRELDFPIENLNFGQVNPTGPQQDNSSYWTQHATSIPGKLPHNRKHKD